MTKKIFIYTFLFLKISILFAFNNSLNIPVFEEKLDSPIPFTTNNEHIRFNEVSLNSTKYFDEFILDTGTNISVIDISIYNTLSLKSMKSVSNVDVLGNIKNRKMVIIDSLKIGNNYFFNVKAIVMDLTKGSGLGCQNIKGIIGNNILKNKIIKINFLEQEINFLNNLNTLSNFNKTPFKLKNNLPYLNLIIGERKYKNCLLDLGDLNQISLKEKDLTSINKTLINEKYTYHLFVNSINHSSYKLYKAPMIWVKNINIKSLSIINPKIHFSHSRRIGLDLFYNSILVIDYKNKNIYTDKSKILMNKKPKNEKFIKVDWNGKVFISQIKVDDLVLKYDIKAGDTVNSINGIDLTVDFSEKDICILLKNLNAEIKKDTFTLKLNRWKTSKKVYAD